MRFLVGTSGYSYKEWKGSFYPADLPDKQMLRYYAERFGTVEINNTFYRMPGVAMLNKWASEVPDDFLFVLKASQQITHFKRLKDAGDSLEYLSKTAGTLSKKLGPFLFQLPPQMKKDLPRLNAFLEVIPKDRRAAFEFRHASWFDDEVLDALRAHHTALCVAEADNDLEVPFVATADWGYVRLREGDYSPKDLREWAKRIRDQKWKEVFVFFKHEDEGKGPKFAAQFLEIVGST